MKKILLIEDRIDRAKVFLEAKNYKTLIEESEKLELFSDKKYQLEKLEVTDFSAILAHKSHRIFAKDKVIFNNLVNQCAKKAIPFIVFSGDYSLGNITQKGLAGGINSKRFYNNLRYFVEAETINTSLLLWGENVVINDYLSFFKKAEQIMANYQSEADLPKIKVQLANSLTSSSVKNDDVFYNNFKPLIEAEETPLKAIFSYLQTHLSTLISNTI